MEINSRILFAIVLMGVMVFAGILFLGSRLTSVEPSLPSPPSTTSRLPDILNLPGFRSDRDQPTSLAQPSGGAPGPDVVVERSELPAPLLPAAPSPPQLPEPKSQTPLPAPAKIPVPLSAPPTFVGAPTPQPPFPSQAAAIASFSVFNVSPQLAGLRTQMVQEGVIQETEFIKINNNGDMEAFMLKMVEWQAKKASSTPEQIQDALDRIRKAYNRIR